MERVVARAKRELLLRAQWPLEPIAFIVNVYFVFNYIKENVYCIYCYFYIMIFNSVANMVKWGVATWMTPLCVCVWCHLRNG